MSVSILVVDDEADVEDLFRQQFRREVRQGQYVIHFAQSAEQALEKLSVGVEPELVVVFSDINMPEMEGTAVLTALRADAELGNCQIVLMTGSAAVTPRRGMQMGADDFLVKPFSVQELLDQMQVFGEEVIPKVK